jgi:hypothetical protein
MGFVLMSEVQVTAKRLEIKLVLIVQFNLLFVVMVLVLIDRIQKIVFQMLSYHRVLMNSKLILKINIKKIV